MNTNEEIIDIILFEIEGCTVSKVDNLIYIRKPGQETKIQDINYLNELHKIGELQNHLKSI